MLNRVDSKLPGLKEKLSQINDQILAVNEIDFDLDVSKAWVPAGVATVKDRQVRIETDLEYTFTTTLKVGAAGFPTADPANDLVPGVEVGALVGVLTINGKPGKPFGIRGKYENTFKEEGQLFLKINAPNGHKSTGKLKVKLSGFVRG